MSTTDTVLEQVARWPVGTVAVGWIGPDGGRQTVGPRDRQFPLASVTKPLFASAVLVAIEEGSLSLEQAAGPDGSTIRHLLAHASGLGNDTETVLMGVGRRRIYSNGGYDLLGAELASATGFTAAEYFHAAIVEPLGLRSTALTGSPAHGAASTVDDLLVVLAEWLDPKLVSGPTMLEAHTAQFPDLSGVLPGYGRHDPNPWGLGFELRGTKQPHWTGDTNSPATFGHFGQAGTFVWVDPEAGVGCVALTDRPFGDWALPLWPALSDAVLAETASGSP